MQFFPARRLAIGAATIFVTGAAAAGPAMAKTFFVSPKGSDNAACTAKKPCKTIDHAVAKAKAGSTVNVAKGTYKESVVITKRIKLLAVGRATIDATGLTNGVVVKGPAAAGSAVQGFVVENALQEGILALQTAHVKILDNIVKDNDKSPVTTTGECAAQGQVPGDCGEGLHLMTVAYSTVRGNTVEGNSGGILSTDELGPTHNNVISFNKVLNNLSDCGITNASHNPEGYVAGKLQPSKGGIYDEVISHNVSDGNGVKGQGAGILMATPVPGGAVYNNTVVDNVADGNGQGGFVLHSHAPGQYLDGNKIIGNTFKDDGVTGDATTGVTKTNGIILFSGVTPLTSITIKDNKFIDEYYGIWEKGAPAISSKANKFSKVTVDVYQAS